MLASQLDVHQVARVRGGQHAHQGVVAAGSSTMLCVLHPWTVASVGLMSQRLEKGGLI